MGSVQVSRDVGAPAEVLWDLVADLPRMGSWSPENTGGRWSKGSSGPAPGAIFRGTNRHGWRRWSTTAVVTACERPRIFEFTVSAVGITVARWGYSFEETGTGCRVTETFTDLRSPLIARLGTPVSGVADRASHNRVTMETTLERLAATAEQVAGAAS